MTIVKHELKQGKSSFLIWTAAIAMLLAVCVFLFPEMKGEMDGISDIFASIGSFTATFGMDRLNFGTIVGFYAIECGNVLGLGGAVMMYFMNLVANIAEVAEGLKYITPFGYCEGSDIVSNGYLDGTLITIGLIFGMVGIVAAYWKYTRKDIHSA